MTVPGEATLKKKFFFLQRLIGEMNRMGMLVDLAHVSEQVMNQVLEISKAPIIFSHSSAYSVCPHKRNVPDYILEKVVRGFKHVAMKILLASMRSLYVT